MTFTAVRILNSDIIQTEKINDGGVIDFLEDE